MLRCLVALVVAGTVAAPVTAGPAYTFTPVAPPGVTYFLPGGINNQGDIAGYSIINNPDGTQTNQSYVSSGGVFSQVNVPGALPGTTLVAGINSLGQYVGGYSDGNGMHAFFYDGSTYHSFDVPGAMFSEIANGVNKNGLVVGGAFGTINPIGYTYFNGKLALVTNPNGPALLAGVNDSGAIVGSYFVNFSSMHGFLLQGGQYTTIDDPNGVLSTGGTALSGINNSGVIVGTYTDANFLTHGFVDQNGAFTTVDNPLGVLNTTISPPAGGTFLTGINDSGDLVGFYTDDTDGVHGFEAIPAAVPEPAGLTLVAVTGLAAACWRLRRRKTTAEPASVGAASRAAPAPRGGLR